jgi:hypothetical protein
VRRPCAALSAAFFLLRAFDGYGDPNPWDGQARAAATALLYPFCRWVAGVKARRRDWWLSYL